MASPVRYGIWMQCAHGCFARCAGRARSSVPSVVRPRSTASSRCPRAPPPPCSAAALGGPADGHPAPVAARHPRPDAAAGGGRSGGGGRIVLMRRCANLGPTAQRQRRRTRDPMAAFDALPAPLRAWLSRAALPWSPASCCASGSDNGRGGHDRPDPGRPGPGRGAGAGPRGSRRTGRLTRSHPVAACAPALATAGGNA